MDITPVIPTGKHIIRGYGNMAFKINDVEHSGGVLLLPEKLEMWEVKSPEKINIDSLGFILENTDNIEILLIGSGDTHAPLPPDIRDYFGKINIGVEMMGTGAACRTYNVLLAEGRSVAAALIAV